MMDFFPANFMLQTPSDKDHQPPCSLPSILPNCTPHEFHGIGPILGKRSMSFSGIDMFHEEANSGCVGGGVGGCGGGVGGSGEEDNLSDDGSQLGEKKRRLNMEQVKTLEKTFQLGNKLDPDRKMQLAKTLGLQPRQIAIWFQNRRARWKTKQLEKDYDCLKRQFDALKADNESLLAQNQKLQSEISTLKGREATESINLNKDTDQDSSSNKSENSSDIRLDISTRTPSTNAMASIESRAFFPPSSSNLSRHNGGGPMAQLFQNPTPVKEENFTNMFCGIDDQSPGFWPWIEQPNFN
ncbi:hypothetical protein V2J09_013013 [Rumex salicifolius]